MKRQRSSVGQNTETQGRASKVIAFMCYAGSSGRPEGTSVCRVLSRHCFMKGMIEAKHLSEGSHIHDSYFDMKNKDCLVLFPSFKKKRKKAFIAFDIL